MKVYYYKQEVKNMIERSRIRKECVGGMFVKKKEG